MAMKRNKVNIEINKDIADFWSDEKKTAILKRIRKGIFLEVGPFEEMIEPKVQRWAHRMVSDEKSLGAHADRQDLKISIRKYLRKQTIIYLGLQKYFPELFIEEGVKCVPK